MISRQEYAQAFEDLVPLPWGGGLGAMLGHFFVILAHLVVVLAHLRFFIGFFLILARFL